MISLTEEEIDDILYCSRANELEELKPYIPSLATKYSTEPASILLVAVDSETGNNSLHYASGNGHLEIIKYLLSQFSPSDPSHSPKILLNAQNQSGNTPLHWAALNGHLAIVKLFLESGADVSVLNGAGHDAVYEAEINDKNDVVEWLLKEGVGLDTGIGGGVDEVDTEDPNIMEGTMNGGTDDLKEDMEKMDIKKDEAGKENGG